MCGVRLPNPPSCMPPVNQLTNDIMKPHSIRFIHRQSVDAKIRRLDSVLEYLHRVGFVCLISKDLIWNEFETCHVLGSCVWADGKTRASTSFSLSDVVGEENERMQVCYEPWSCFIHGWWRKTLRGARCCTTPNCLHQDVSNLPFADLQADVLSPVSWSKHRSIPQSSVMDPWAPIAILMAEWVLIAFVWYIVTGWMRPGAAFVCYVSITNPSVVCGSVNSPLFSLCCLIHDDYDVMGSKLWIFTSCPHSRVDWVAN